MTADIQILFAKWAFGNSAELSACRQSLRDRLRLTSRHAQTRHTTLLAAIFSPTVENRTVVTAKTVAVLCPRRSVRCSRARIISRLSRQCILEPEKLNSTQLTS